MKKIIVISAISIIMTALTACQPSANVPEAKKVVVEAPKPPVNTPKDTPSSTDKPPVKPDENKKPSTSTPESIPSKGSDVSALYTGQIDGNSIEVEINKNKVALFFSKNVKASFDPSLFKIGSTVQVTYEKNNKGQVVLTGIQK